MDTDGRNTDVRPVVKEKPSAFDVAVKFLSVSPRSEKELRDRLYKKGYHRMEVEEAMEKCRRYGYVDDARYVADFVEYYGAKLGRKKLIYKLTAEKGISAELARFGVEDAVSDDAEREKALVAARKCAASKKVREKKDLPKVGAYLYQRGFAREEIDRALSVLSDELFSSFGDE